MLLFRTVHSYGCTLLSKIAPTRVYLHEFPTTQGRKLLCADFKVNGRTLKIATVHLGIQGVWSLALLVLIQRKESYARDRPVRKVQLDISFDQLKPSDDAILMGKSSWINKGLTQKGDFNFGDHGNENSVIAEGYSDVYRELYPLDDTVEGRGWTFDYQRVWRLFYLSWTATHHEQQNKMTNDLGALELKRLDRFLLRSKDGWKVEEMTIIGTQPIDMSKITEGKNMLPVGKSGKTTTLWPSDHFG